MDRQQIGLKLALDALGQPLDLTSFDMRLVLQKSVYLVQSAGIDLGYSFNWYLKGPYSPGLTRDAFALRAQNTEELTGWKLSESTVDRLNRLGQFFQSLSSGDLARELELLASVHFLLRTRQATIANVPGLREVLHRNHKEYSEAEVRKAIEDLETHDLLPPAR